MPDRPKLLDVCCCAGGCSMGYYDAGFDVVGVDNKPRRDYPFEFVEADMLDVLADRDYLDGFDVVHVSPPCQLYSDAINAHKNPEAHRDWIPLVRDLLRTWGGCYVIENVPRAPLLDPVLICGWAMGLRYIKRHRLFESNMPLMSPGCACTKSNRTVSVFGHSGEDRRGPVVLKHVRIDEVRELMQVPWIANRDGISQSIPPPYTQYLGEQMIDYLKAIEPSALAKTS